MAEFDEEDHPRDALGRWSDVGGGASAAQLIGRAKIAHENSGGLFDPKELQDLPEQVKQSEKDGDKLFEQAREAHEMQLDLLDRDKGLSKDIGAKTIRGDKMPLGEFVKNIEKSTDEPGPMVVIGPMKSKERSEEKVKADGAGDWSTLTDVVRSTVAVDTMSQVGDVVRHLQAHGIQLARKPTDRFTNPTVAGYRDLMLKVKYPNGHVGEIQVQIKGMLKAKEKAHGHYEKVRSIEAKLKTENRAMTDSERKTYDEANSKMKEIYSSAWHKANARPDKRSDFETLRENLF